MLDTYICAGIFNLGSFQLGLELSEKQVGLPLGSVSKKEEIKMKSDSAISYLLGKAKMTNWN